MSRIGAFFKAHRLLFAAFFTPTLLLFIIYAACQTFPFGDRSVLVLDLAGQYVYFFSSFREAFLGEGSLLYSFSRAMGGEMLGIFAYYLASPFSFLVLLFPKEQITAAILLILLLKTGGAGATMALYLRRKHPTLPPHLLLTLCTAYALCGFALAYQSNTMWFDAFILLPLTLYGLEDLIQRRSPFLYVIALALTLLTNYYMGYMTALFCALFFLYTCLCAPRISKRNLTTNATIFTVSSVLALLISSIVLFPAIYSLSFGKSDFIPPAQREGILLSLADLLRKSLPATYDSLLDGAAPFLYCGSFAVLLLPCYFLSGSIPKRQRIGDAILLLLLTICMIAEPLDRVWHGFSAPNGLPFRYAFFLSFLLLVKAADVLSLPVDQTLSPRKRLLPLGITAALLTASIPLLYRAEPTLSASPYFLPTALCGVLLSALCLAFHFLPFGKLHTKRISTALLCAVVLAELVGNGIATQNRIHEDVAYTAQSVFDESTAAHMAATGALYAMDGGFYRAESTEHLKANDNFLSGLHGISGSTSTLHADSIRLLSQLGIPARWHRSDYLFPNPFTDSLLGIRYVLSEDAIPFYAPTLTASGLTAYQNEQALPLVYAIESASIPDFDRNPAKNCNLLADHLLGTDAPDVFLPLSSDQTYYGGCKAYPSDEGTTVYLPTEGDDTTFVTLSVTIAETGDVFFTLPSPIPSPVYFYVGDRYLGVQYDTAASYLLYLGRFEAGETVRVRMITSDKDRPLQPYQNEPHFYYYNDTAAATVLSTLSGTALSLDAACTDTRLTGTLTTKKERTTLLFTAPYDKNWQILVDGERVDTQKALGALIAFCVEGTGVHRIELRYRSPQLIVGACVSALGIAALCGAAYLERKKHFLCNLP